jgi:serine/threonine protein kinase
MQTVDLPPGTLFASRYEVRRVIGRGGMSVVFEAHDNEREELVALKVLAPDLSLLPEMERRFASEIPAAARIRQTNVCHIYDWGLEDGLRYIAMERVPGDDLGRTLLRDGAFPIPLAFDLAIQLARGVQALHAAGILHRDIKPKNVVRGLDGELRIMDFDIAKHCIEGQDLAHEAGFGTPEYASPEQACGGPVDFRSDIYSLGVVIFELFTGRVPFRASTSVETVKLHLHAPVPLEGPDAPPLPRALVPILRRTLAKERDHRYKTVKGLAEALRLARSVTAPDEIPPRPRGDATVSSSAPTVARALPALLSALNPKDKTVRWTPKAGPPLLDTKTRLAIAALLDTLKEEEATGAEPRASGIRALLEALGNEDDRVRQDAALALTQMLK